MFQESVAADCSLTCNSKFSNFGELQCKEAGFCHLRNYDLSFAFYSKFPSWGSIAGWCCSEPTSLKSHQAVSYLLPSVDLFIAWWQYKISWNIQLYLSLLWNGLFDWVHLWRLSSFNYRWTSLLFGCFLFCRYIFITVASFGGNG